MPLFPAKQPRNANIVELPPTELIPLHSDVDSDGASPTALQAEAVRGTELALSTLRTAGETHEVALATADRLHAQTKQLERVAEIVDETHNVLDGAEVVVDKLVKNKLRRAAEKPFRKVAAVRVDALRIRKGKDGRGGKKQGLKEEKIDMVQVEGVVEEYEDFEDEVVREQLKRQDRYLEETEKIVEELRDIAVDIGEHVDMQVEIVEGIDAPELTQRIRRNRLKINRALKL